MNTNLSIKCWAEDDRPREKMLLKGKSALSDAELLALLLGSGSSNQSAVELAKVILSKHQNLDKLGRCSIAELRQFKGVGKAKAVTIAACFELGNRRKEVGNNAPKKITSSKTAYQTLRLNFLDLEHEEFHILLLNRGNFILHQCRISVGGMTGTVADGKIIFKKALQHSACGIILAHNHPSGNLQPSHQDKALTKKLKDFGNLIDLSVLDHLIVGKDNYFSFADNGLLE